MTAGLAVRWRADDVITATAAKRCAMHQIIGSLSLRQAESADNQKAPNRIAATKTNTAPVAM
jgi:hypothetical protein